MLNIEKQKLSQKWEKEYFFLKQYIKFIYANWKNKEPLFVYQMGRVGSATIVKSLMKSGFGKRIYHTHFLTEEGLTFLQEMKNRAFGDWANVPKRSRQYILQSYFLKQKIKKDFSQGKKYKFVTLVRDPIATNISGFLHSLDSWLFPVNLGSNYEKKTNIEDLKKLEECFFNKYPHDYPLNWLGRELQNFLDIDIYSTNFPKSQGYKIYRGQLVELLLIKLESLNDCGGEAFKYFLNLENFNLVKANASSGKDYYRLYKDFLDYITLPDSYLERMYSSKYAQHFYEKKEIDHFKAKWQKDDNEFGK